MLDFTTIQEIAGVVDDAQSNAVTITKFTDAHPDMTIEDSYAVQDELLRRWESRGRKLAGLKAGLTSKAKMEQMGVHVPSFGMLMGDTCYPDGATIPCSGLIHPRVEAEIAFVLKDALAGPNLTIEQVLAATDFIQPAIEIIDSRFEKFKFDLVSVIADNGSSARFALGGRPRRPTDVDLATIGIVLEKNGEPAQMASSAAVLGHPARAVQMLVSWLHERGRILDAGSIVLSGAATEAVAVGAGDAITARFQEMGSMTLRFA